MARKCKICGLPEELRLLIEDDIRNHVKPSLIISKYPQAGLNHSNIETHKKHFKKQDAIEEYESKLQVRATKATSNRSSTPSLPSNLSPNQVTPEEEPQSPEPPAPLPDSTDGEGVQRTGNPIVDDLTALDLIIGQAGQILDKVKPPDVIKAIETKQKLLGNMEDSANADESEKVNIALILQAIANEE